VSVNYRNDKKDGDERDGRFDNGGKGRDEARERKEDGALEENHDKEDAEFPQETFHGLIIARV